jgi:hypothetical protein
MEGQRTAKVDSLISDFDLKEEVSDVDTDEMVTDTDEIVTDTTTSDEESSTQFCPLSSGPVRTARTVQRYPSVDEWLLGWLQHYHIFYIYKSFRTINKCVFRGG